MACSECDGVGCWAHLEWFCEHAGLARVFKAGDKYGDPYCYAIPFVVRERFAEPDKSGALGFIEMVGVIKVMTPCQYRALGRAAKSHGWRVLSTRIKGGKAHTIEVLRHV